MTARRATSERRRICAVRLPLEQVLDDDGMPMHADGCADVCDLFGMSVDRLGALYRAAPPVPRTSSPAPVDRAHPGRVDLECELCGRPTRGTRAKRFCSKYCSNAAQRERRRVGVGA